MFYHKQFIEPGYITWGLCSTRVIKELFSNLTSAFLSKVYVEKNDRMKEFFFLERMLGKDIAYVSWISFFSYEKLGIGPKQAAGDWACKM